MNAQEYAPLARRTLKELPFKQHMIHMGLGVTGEMGELIDAAKKHLIYGKPLDLTNMLEEAGDTLWYIANLLPELRVSADFMQMAISRGEVKGAGWQSALTKDPFQLGEALLAINKAMADVCNALLSLSETDHIGTSYVYNLIEQMAGNVGVICGLLGIDSSDAMGINIDKLAARYGDKYSDFAAVNRDTEAERAVLEGKLPPAPTLHRYSFEALIEFGRGYYAEKKLPLSLDGMAWSFTAHGLPVTHENNDTYIVNDMRFNRGETLVISVSENGTACWTEPATEVH